ncbi:Fic family protein [Sphingomonas sp. SUN039]|uniref:Fic/DOC family protein n=1 Tax=Sphingomonas sp. SUN039 TaxID=2937787 RepID=UPI0021645EE9|nr:Fic family protein [Sphingomonas sp. SUN039]UVO53401.1 Fic family protein [Sphingomonas sp. SUN039]
MSDDVYCYPGTHILRNLHDLTDADELDRVERRLVADRFAEGAPTGNFDLPHLRAIHRHLFQDIYDWAGEIRTLEIAKGGSQFMYVRYIATGMADVHRRVIEWKYLRGLDADEFAAKAGEIIGDINHIHPFREGNGRTQLTYLLQLAAQAGHVVDVRAIDRTQWYAASVEAHKGHFEAMAEAIGGAIARERNS